MARHSHIPNQQPLEFDRTVTEEVSMIPNERVESTRVSLGSLAMTPEEMASTPPSKIEVKMPNNARDRLIIEDDELFRRKSKAQYNAGHGTSRYR